MASLGSQDRAGGHNETLFTGPQPAKKKGFIRSLGGMHIQSGKNKKEGSSSPPAKKKKEQEVPLQQLLGSNPMKQQPSTTYKTFDFSPSVSNSDFNQSCFDKSYGR